MKKLRLELTAKVVDAETGDVLASQDLTFTGASPSIHDMVTKGGGTFIYGLGVSLTNELLGMKPEPKEK